MTSKIERLECRRLLAAGDVDTAYGALGKSTGTFVGSADDSADAVAMLGDGKILVGGNLWAGDSFITLTRYNANGTLDATFGSNGYVPVPNLPWRSMIDMAVNSDGAILALSSQAVSSTTPMIQRFTASGAIDSTWIGPGTSLTGTPRALLPIAGGKTLVATGAFLARLNADGTLDSTFSGGGKVALPTATFPNFHTYPPYALATQADGSILVAGEQFGISTGNRQAMIRRYTAAGVLDTSFGSGGTLLLPVSTVDSSARQMKIQSDGKIVIAGYSGADSFVARFQSTGAIDGTFGVSGVRIINGNASASDKAHSLAINASNQIYVGGTVDEVGAYFARLTSSGALDNTFDGNGIVEQPWPAEWPLFGSPRIALSASGQLISGWCASSSFNENFGQILSRHTLSGALDSTFGTLGGYTRVVRSKAHSLYVGRSTLQADGKLIQVATSRDTAGNAIVRRVNADGTLDTAFGVNGYAEIDCGARNEYAKDVLVQPDGKIVVVGRASSLIGPAATATWQDNFFIARLNANGSVDTSFAVNGSNSFNLVNGRWGELQSVTLLSDGRIVAAGVLQDSSWNAAAVVMRFSTSGGLDLNFGGAARKVIDLAGTEERIVALAADGTGVFIAGQVQTTSSNSDRFVARLDHTGNYDSSFGVGGVRTIDNTASDSAFGMVFDPDTGTIYSGGTSASAALITKLNAAGTIDTTFATAGTASVAFPTGVTWMSEMLLAPQGQVVLATTQTNTGSNRDYLLMRLTSAGALDNTFGVSGRRTIDLGSASDFAFDVHLTPDNRYLVAGQHNAGSTGFGAASVLGSSATAPIMLGRDFRFTPDAVFHLLFDGNVLASVESNDLVAYNVTTGQRFSSWTMLKSLTSGSGDTVVDWMSATPLPEGVYYVTIAAGLRTVDGSEFGQFAFDLFIGQGTSGFDAYHVRRLNSSTLQVSRNTGASNINYTLPIKPWSFVWMNGGAGDDTATVDQTFGSLLPMNSVQFDGGGGNDALAMYGVNSSDAYAVSPTGISGNIYVGMSNSEGVLVGNGTYTFTDNIGSNINVSNSATATFNAAQRLKLLNVGGTARVGAGGGSARVVVTEQLILGGSGKLDLTEHALVWDHNGTSPIGEWNGTNYTGVTGWVRAGRNGGAWNGNGIITSMSDAQDAAPLMTIAVVEAADALQIQPGQTKLWHGQSVDASSVLVGYTFAGDLDLNGRIDADDYFWLDRGFATGRKGHGNGDIDYNGRIDADDFFLIDLNYHRSRAAAISAGAEARPPEIAFTSAWWAARDVVDEEADDLPVA